MSDIAIIEPDRLPEQIRQIRQNKGLSQENMADALGISTTAYGDLERGKTEVTLSRLTAVATILNVSVPALLGVEDEVDRLREENRRLTRENMALLFRCEVLDTRLRVILEAQQERKRIGF